MRASATSLPRAARRLALALLLAALAAGLGAAAAAAQRTALSPADEAAARRQQAGILAAYAQGDSARARALSLALLERSPQWQGAPALRRQLAEGYLAEARWALALEQLGRLLEDYPASAERWPGILLKARALAASGRALEAALGLDRALEDWSEARWRPQAEATLDALIAERLGAADLQTFIARRGASPRRGAAQGALARAEAAGRAAPGAGATGAAGPATAAPPAAAAPAAPRAAGPSTAPAPAAASAAPALLATGARGDGGLRLGLLAPLSGRYAVYGEAFREGARLAVSRYNAERGADIQLLAADTEGEPVPAALAARRLIVQERVVALLGEVLSTPTIAAAVEANARGVPLLSPAATAEDIHELGEWVFQNRISSDAQALALARVAVTDLLGARLAVLYPKQGDGEQLAHLFEETVDALGGEIVAATAYEVGATDFGDVLDEIRRAQPELLFLPGEAEQLVLLVPQLGFYGIDAQLLGNDAWNSRRLLRQGGPGLEGAVFPSDLLLQRDRALYADFQRLHAARFESGAQPVAARAFLGMMLLLEVIGEVGGEPAAMRAALAARTGDGGDERARREALAAQVTLMSIAGGELAPYLPGTRWLARDAAPGAGFIDEP